MTAIAWTDHTFNPWWGCARVSPGCENCYAERDSKRYGFNLWGKGEERRFFGDKHWNDPVRWNRAAEKAGIPARVFCASMADVLEDRRDLDGPRLRLQLLVESTPWLQWQVLTKRPQNADLLKRWREGWPLNAWAGVTAEDQPRADERIPLLLKIPASVRFVSYEPALGPVVFHRLKWDPTLGPKPGAAVDWIIVGGESGSGARTFDIDWARSAIEQCREAGVACFVKQLGSRIRWGTMGGDSGSAMQSRSAGGIVDPKGGDPSEWPEDLRVREFPKQSRSI